MVEHSIFFFNLEFFYLHLKNKLLKLIGGEGQRPEAEERGKGKEKNKEKEEKYMKRGKVKGGGR